ncbi:hypothetical protein ACVNIS_18625 [Sphaerotilaceae bacterium SBD11-9]
MIVLIAGMQRSGSTFSFNIAREMLIASGSVYQESQGSVCPVIERSGSAKHLILKAHAIDEVTCRMVQLGGIKVVCTIRKPEDAIASWMETFGFNLEDSIGHMREWIRMFGQLKDYALVVEYDDIDWHPFRAGRRIARHIRPDSGLFEIWSAVRRNAKAAVKEATDQLVKEDAGVIDIGFSHYNNVTFFHRRHISTLVSRSAPERISLDSVKIIRSELSEFLSPDGRLIW